MKNAIFGTLIAAGALAVTPAMAQEMTPEAPVGTTEVPAGTTMDGPAIDAPATSSQVPPATMDSNGDGVMDAWDRNGDGTADAWDTNGDGQPDKADPMEAAE